MLTCIAKVENTKLISNMEWRDPYDRVVGPIKSMNKGGDNTDMYTESQNGILELVFNSLKADQAGRYVCTATYANNEPLSKSVKIEIVDPITFTYAPIYQYPIINEEYTIQCQVTARPPPIVTWYRDDVPILSDGNQYVVETHGLKIFKVQQSHEGVYRCRASVPETGSFFDRIINVEVHKSLEEKEPLREEKKITPIIDTGLRRETSKTFDGKCSVSNTGFVGKVLAV
ncbi:hypothetical protein HCN44_006966 [Aphidius gifuensis]|uniref:Ig-like domain-containing protein n=1 Tax=Aphidius gifuensis TaxID=684658 RepID=A0A834Y2K5_APHGI|nr:hypothetical protein HCN44_006966 [Aphidius gifuensis]